MTSQPEPRAPEAPRDERLLPHELETIRQHHRQTSNSSSLIVAALLADHDALTAEIDGLRAAAEGRVLEASSTAVLRAIHRDNGEGYCTTCNERFPCLTILEVEVLAEENERLREVLEDMVDLDPYGVDAADYWCIYCGEHGDKPEAIKHDPLCTWVRAEAALAGRADGGAEGEC